MTDQLDRRIRTLMVQVVDASPEAPDAEQIEARRATHRRPSGHGADEPGMLVERRPAWDAGLDRGHRSRRPGWVAVAAAMVMIVAVGGVAWLLTRSQEPPLITQVPTPTSLPGPTSTMPETATTLLASPNASLADLLEWTIVTLPGEVAVDCSDRQLDPNCTEDHGVVLQDVIVADDGLVAVGHDGSTGQWRGVVFTSTDGEDWSRALGPQTESVQGNEDINAVAMGEDTSVAVGARDCDPAAGIDSDRVEACPLVWISDDGENWQSVGWEAFRTYDGTPFGDAVAEGEFAPDLSFGPADYRMNDVAWTGDLFVAVGNAIWTSPDGTTWTMTPLPSVGDSATGECSPRCRANSVLVTSDGIVAAGKDGSLPQSPQGGKASMWLSPDGLTWSQIQPDLPWYSEFSVLVATSDRYLAIIEDGVAVTTEDPLDWSGIDPVPLPAEPVLSGRSSLDAVVDGERIVVVGYQQAMPQDRREGGAARIWISLDGGMSFEAYLNDDMSLFGHHYSLTATARMRSAVLFEDRIVVVGRYYADAAVWAGTWTD